MSLILLILLILLIIIIVINYIKKDNFITNKPIIGKHLESSYPHLSNDFWYEIVDNKLSFFLRTHENKKYKIDIIKFLDAKNHKINIIINNQLDISLLNNNINNVLNHKNLNKLFITNPIIEHYKIEPIPIGLKWQFKSTYLYGEPKQKLLNIYNSISSSPNESYDLFNNSRINKILIRPMTNSNISTKNYNKNNNALKTNRNQIYKILKGNSNVFLLKNRMNLTDYLKILTKYKFVISPAGNGLDSHSTYEALLCGCIPIVPRTTLTKLYNDLPVLQIDDWNELNNINFNNLINEFDNKQYNFDKIFYNYWKEKINEL